MNLTIDTIRAAQDNDLAAITAVIEATESRVIGLADKAARRMAPNGGDRFAEYREEFAQAGRVTVWESLSRFTGDSVDSFFAFMYTTVERALLDSVRSERNSGADPDALKIFGAMLELADGDEYLAEKLCQTVPPKGRRMGAARASAARLAWQGADSLDVPVRNDAGRPGKGSVSVSLAESLPAQHDVPDDLITADDITREDARIKRALVNGILDVMGEAQAQVLRHSFGIGDALCFGHGANGDDEGLAAELGSTVPKVRDARTKGLKAFAKRYVRSVAATDPERAAELESAAAVQLRAGGRK